MRDKHSSIPQSALLKHQRGQAMIEFAIIGLLLILLIAGGVELGIAAFNSNRTSEGAKAGAAAWVNGIGSGNVYTACMLISSSDPYYADDCENISAGSVYNTYGFALERLIPEDANIRIGMGNHADISAFRRPSCNLDGSYDDGLPEENQVYLYNPLPVDITECLGNDALELSVGKTRSRVTVLFTGHSREVHETMPSDPMRFSGLPVIHQSIYSQYETVCTSPDTYLPCTRYNPGDGHRKLMKLPGHLDPSDETAMSALPKIVQIGNAFVLDPEIEPNPKPTFNLLCRARTIPESSTAFGACDTNVDPQDICWSAETGLPLLCDAMVETRYRHTFESFVGMTMAEDTPTAMAPVVEDAAIFMQDQTPGTLGSDLQLGNAPKPFRDFYGCYQTNATLLVPGTGSPRVNGINLTSCN